MREYKITISVRTAEGVKSFKRTSTRKFDEICEADQLDNTLGRINKIIQKFVKETNTGVEKEPLPLFEKDPVAETPTGT